MSYPVYYYGSGFGIPVSGPAYMQDAYILSGGCEFGEETRFVGVTDLVIIERNGGVHFLKDAKHLESPCDYGWVYADEIDTVLRMDRGRKAVLDYLSIRYDYLTDADRSWCDDLRIEFSKESNL